MVLDFAEAPAWIGKVIIALLALGFFIALALAWLFDITPEGVQRDDGNTEVNGVLAQRLNLLTIFAAVGVASIFAWQQFRGPENTTTTAPQEATVSQSSGTAAEVDIDNVSIAVLPFIDLSQKGDQEFFADGISEEILNALRALIG